MAQTQFRSDDTVKWWLGFGNGSDGAYSSAGNATDAPVDSACTGTAGTTSLTATNASFANGKPILIHQTQGTGAGKWELNQIASYATGTITTLKPIINSYVSGAQVIQLKEYLSFTQNTGHTLTAKAWNGTVGGFIVFLCKNAVTIDGTITTVGKGFISSNHYLNTNSGTTRQGEGSGSTTESQLLTANGNGGGGGGGSTGDAGAGSCGGSGGSKTAGVNGYNYGYSTAAGGNAVWADRAGIVTLGGGAGGVITASAINFGGWGTSGSGLMFIFARSINVGSSAAINLYSGNASTATDKYWGGAGGAGSGLLVGQTINVNTNKINATGGTARGGNGGSGGIVALYSSSISGTTTPTLDATLDPTIHDPYGGYFYTNFI